MAHRLVAEAAQLHGEAGLGEAGRVVGREAEESGGGASDEAVHRGTQRRQRSCRVRKVVHQRTRHCREENEH